MVSAVLCSVLLVFKSQQGSLNTVSAAAILVACCGPNSAHFPTKSAPPGPQHHCHRAEQRAEDPVRFPAVVLALCHLTALSSCVPAAAIASGLDCSTPPPQRQPGWVLLFPLSHPHSSSRVSLAQDWDPSYPVYHPGLGPWCPFPSSPLHQ